jgi:MoaA/NifB/PqqE/SkfB family radical SAM enzyme
MRKERGRVLVTGWPVSWIKLKAGVTLLRISVSSFRNPFTSLRALFVLLGQRKRLHGNRRDHKIVRSGNQYYWSIYTPGFPSRGFNAMIEQEIRRASEQDVGDIPLQTLILSISSRCHYQCEHCFEGKNLEKWEQITIADLVKILREAIKMGIPHIQIGGGEPMLRFRDLLRLLEIGKGHTEFWLSTSGYGLTREKAWDLRIAGLTGASISLDHWTADTHNRFRKHPEAYRWVLEAVENCKAVGIIPNLTLCVTHGMAREEQLMRYMTLARNMGIPFVRFLEARKAGNYEGQDVLLTREEQQTIVDFVLKMNGSKKYRSYPIIQYPGYHQRKIGCYGAGNRYIHIDSAGNYHSCPFCRGAVGNIKEMDLKEGIRLLREQGCQLFKTNPHA